jgi:hypothetical protein
VTGRGATETDKATVMVGISTDEFYRASNRRPKPYEIMSYPLLDLGLSRLDCMNVIKAAGLPVPPKSACWFCPFHTVKQWRTLRADHPDRFEAAARLEDHLNAERAAKGKDEVFLSHTNTRLRRAIPELVPLPFDEDPVGGECDSGWCMT